MALKEAGLPTPLRLGCNGQELDRERIGGHTADALSCVKMNIRLVCERITKHTSTHAINNHVPPRKVAECNSF